MSTRDSYFDSYFTYDENLMYAFGISAYDSNPEPIEDPSIGVLRPYYKSWGIIEGGGVNFEPLPERNCTSEELHIDGDSDQDSLFYKPHPNSVNDLNFYNKKLKCLDVDSI